MSIQSCSYTYVFEAGKGLSIKKAYYINDHDIASYVTIKLMVTSCVCM